MIQVNATIFLQVINFLLLVYLLNRFLLKPVRAVLRQRREYVGGKYAQVEELHRCRQDRLERYESELSKARSEANLKRQRLKEAATEQEVLIVEQANGEAEEIIKRIQVELSLETEKVRGELQQQIKDIADLVAKKVLGREA